LKEEEWENLCKKCGKCCFEKLEFDDGTIYYTATPCKYLDISTRHCKIYPKRFKIYPECVKLTSRLVETLPWLPSDCAYKNELHKREEETEKE